MYIWTVFKLNKKQEALQHNEGNKKYNEDQFTSVTFLKETTDSMTRLISKQTFITLTFTERISKLQMNEHYNIKKNDFELKV